MDANKMFEFAARNKLRYPYKGVATTEDLWDLNVQALDQIYKSLKSQEKKAQEESLLSTRTQEDEELAVKIEIVRYIVNVKLAEAEQAAKAREMREQKQKIMGILAEKQDQELRNKSPEELQAMLASMS